MLTRRARSPVLLPRGRALAFLRGEIQHKNLWLVYLGHQAAVTNLLPNFDSRDFDISPDGCEVVLERVYARMCHCGICPNIIQGLIRLWRGADLTHPP